MSRFQRTCLFASFFLLLLLAVLSLYDAQWGNNDGLIKAYAYRNWIYLLLGWVLLFGLLATLLRSRMGWVRSVGTFALSGVVTLLVLEAICWGLARLGTLPLRIAHYRLVLPVDQLGSPTRYAGDFSRLAGRWRLPNAHEELVNCAGDSLHRRSNEWGAADRARSAADSAKKRVLVLGDSFVEGFMVNAPDRMTDLLEQRTGLDHLNFGINGSAPISYWLRYNEYGPKLAHGAVLVGLLPGNDFQDYTPAVAHELVDSPIYRPYYAGTYPNFQVRYSLADISQSIAARDRTPAKLLATLDSVYWALPMGQKVKVHTLHSYLVQTLFWLGQKVSSAKKQPYTRYNTFTDDEWLTMQYSLEQIKKQAGSRPVVLYSIPIMSDIEAIRAGAPNRFDPRMEAFCQKNGIGFLPLLPHFLAYKGTIKDLYVACDGHWSTQGERFVTDVLLKSEVYQNAIK